MSSALMAAFVDSTPIPELFNFNSNDTFLTKFHEMEEMNKQCGAGLESTHRRWVRQSPARVLTISMM